MNNYNNYRKSTPVNPIVIMDHLTMFKDTVPLKKDDVIRGLEELSKLFTAMDNNKHVVISNSTHKQELDEEIREYFND